MEFHSATKVHRNIDAMKELTKLSDYNGQVMFSYLKNKKLPLSCALLLNILKMHNLRISVTILNVVGILVLQMIKKNMKLR